MSETSFYKHIDADLPEPDRLRQLLIWCSSRATASPHPSTTASPSIPLASLSDKSKQALKSTQDDLIHKLAERRIDLSIYSSGSEPSEKPQTENAQNVTNRGWEVTYKSQIDQYVSRATTLLMSSAHRNGFSVLLLKTKHGRRSRTPMNHTHAISGQRLRSGGQRMLPPAPLLSYLKTGRRQLLCLPRPKANNARTQTPIGPHASMSYPRRSKRV